MYVLDKFVDGKLQLTDCWDLSTKLGFLGGDKIKSNDEKMT